MAKTITITLAGNGWIVRADYGESKVRTTVATSTRDMIESVAEFARENYETLSSSAANAVELRGRAHR